MQSLAGKVGSPARAPAPLRARPHSGPAPQRLPVSGSPPLLVLPSPTPGRPPRLRAAWPGSHPEPAPQSETDDAGSPGHLASSPDANPGARFPRPFPAAVSTAGVTAPHTFPTRAALPGPDLHPLAQPACSSRAPCPRGLPRPPLQTLIHRPHRAPWQLWTPSFVQVFMRWGSRL